MWKNEERGGETSSKYWTRDSAESRVTMAGLGERPRIKDKKK
jgi:hypothetical protein